MLPATGIIISAAIGPIAPLLQRSIRIMACVTGRATIRTSQVMRARPEFSKVALRMFHPIQRPRGNIAGMLNSDATRLPLKD